MNMKSFAIVLGSAAMFFAAGCVVTSSTGGTGGSTSSSGGGNDGTGGKGTGGTMGVGGNGSGGAGGAAACMSCGLFITNGTATDTLCDGNSTKLYDDLALCICGDANNPAIDSACGASSKTDTSCADNSCAGKDPTAECNTCQTAANQGPCKMQFDACASDI